MQPNGATVSALSQVTGWVRSLLSLTFVATLLGLGLSNVALRATWNEVEDGILWVTGPDGVTAADVAPDGPGTESGIRAGDVLLAIDGRPVQRPADVVATLHAGQNGTRLNYTVVRLGAREVRQVRLAPLYRGNTPLYYVLAAVGIFTLIVGAAVRFRRPGDEATLHFFWVCLAFFGAFTFSFNGRLDRLDWVFYWADAVSILLLPPLFLHFTLVFPERPRSWVRSTMGQRLLPLLYLPALGLGLLRVVAIARAPVDAKFFTHVLGILDRIDPLHLSICMAAGLAVLVHALSHVRSVTARRQLRWIERRDVIAPEIERIRRRELEKRRGHCVAPDDGGRVWRRGVDSHAQQAGPRRVVRAPAPE